MAAFFSFLSPPSFQRPRLRPVNNWSRSYGEHHLGCNHCFLWIPGIRDTWSAPATKSAHYPNVHDKAWIPVIAFWTPDPKLKPAGLQLLSRNTS